MSTRRLRKLSSVLCASALLLASAGAASPAPEEAQSSRVYVANEATSTISVIDSRTDSIVHTICLGSGPVIPGTPQPAGPCNAVADHHKPFYDGHLDTHGLWLTPDGSLLLAANRISGTVVAVDTDSGSMLGYAPTGREPHLATVHPGGREAWVAVRGEAHIEVLKLDRDDLYRADLRSSERMERTAAINTMQGPSMVSFTSDGQWAFVASGKEARADKIHVESREVVASAPVVAPFTPFGLVSPDDQELYLIHKGAGQLSILLTDDLRPVVEGLPIGPRPNHVAFVGPYAYITIGGPAPAQGNPDPEGKIVVVDRATHTIVRELTGTAWTGEPHGIWPSSDGQKLYIGHERGDRVTVLGTGNPEDPGDDAVQGLVTGTPEQLAFLKKPIDIVVRP